jgi:hypothetical protein
MNYSVKERQANSDTPNWNLQDAHSKNYEVKFRPDILSKRSTAIRFLAYTNYANVSDYYQAIEQYQQKCAVDENMQALNINDLAQQVSPKYGFVLNSEQNVTETLRACVRLVGMKDRMRVRLI